MTGTAHVAGSYSSTEAADAGVAAATGCGFGAIAGAPAGPGAAAGAAAAPLAAAGAGPDAGAASPPSLLKREGASSGIVSSGCSARARCSSTSGVSGLFGSGTQQSTGHTAAHAS